MPLPLRTLVAFSPEDRLRIMRLLHTQGKGIVSNSEVTAMKTKLPQINCRILPLLVCSRQHFDLTLLLLFFAPFVDPVEVYWLVTTAALSLLLKVR